MTEVAKQLSLTEALAEVKQYDWDGEYREAARAAVKELLERRMESRIDDYLTEIASRDGAGSDRRNGYYERHLLLEVGDVALSVPRTRRTSAAEVLGKFRRRSREVERLILECFLLGCSTRKVGQALLPVLGERVSASTVSEVARQLDGLVVAYHRRRLADRYRVLLFDGVVMKQRTGMGSVKRVVLVALGILADGRKEVIDFYLARGESQEEWEAFLNDLYHRGLTGERAELIVVDGGKGMLAALGLVYARVPVQRCWAHKTRNVVDKVRQADREAVKGGLHQISHARNLKEARRAAGRFAAKWESVYPKAVACLREDLDFMLEFYRFEPAWRAAVRTTNAIERRFEEVRRRTRPMGVFSDRTSVERILYAVLMHENYKQRVNPLLVVTQNT